MHPHNFSTVVVKFFTVIMHSYINVPNIVFVYLFFLVKLFSPLYLMFTFEKQDICKIQNCQSITYKSTHTYTQINVCICVHVSIHTYAYTYLHEHTDINYLHHSAYVHRLYIDVFFSPVFDNIVHILYFPVTYLPYMWSHPLLPCHFQYVSYLAFLFHLAISSVTTNMAITTVNT